MYRKFYTLKVLLLFLLFPFWSFGQTYQVSTLAGTGSAGAVNGTGTAASFNLPQGVAVDNTGNVFVADRLNHVIRKITPAGLVTTIAGTGAPGYANGTGTSAAFNYPSSVAVDGSGNLYVADYYNHRIRKITASGVVTTLAGSGSVSFADGTGEAAAFSYPISVAVDASENVYVGDSYNHRVRKITSDGIVTTLAGSGNQDYVNGIGTSAAFNFPYGVAVDIDGNVYVADLSNQRIRKITADGVVTTLAGSGNSGFADGTGTAASFSNASGVATDASGNVYVADYLNHRIRKITAAGVVTTLAGTGTAGNDNGIANTASFRNPYGVALDAIGNIYAADFSNHLIRKITICYTPPTPTISGNPEICFGGSTVLTSSSATGNLWNTGETTQSITVSTAGEYTVQVIDNACTSAISEPLEIIVNSLPQAPTITGNTTINVGGITVLTSSIADGNLWSTGETTQSIIVSTIGAYSVKSIVGTCTSASSNTIVVDRNVLDYRVSTLAGSGIIGYADGTGENASFRYPMGAAIDNGGNVYVADQDNHRIRKITSTGVVSTFAGSGSAGYSDGTGFGASFNQPSAIVIGLDGNLYVTDQTNHRIRKITSDGVVTTFAGSGSIGFTNGPGTDASFSYPLGMAIDDDGNLYVADLGNHAIRKITSAGVVSTLAGSGSSGVANGIGINATFFSPTGVAVDYLGNVYVADQGNNLIRKITTDRVVTTFAGSGSAAYADGVGTAASFDSPFTIAADAAGNLFVNDYSNRRIRKISSSQVVTTIAGNGDYAYLDGLGTQAAFKAPAYVTIDEAGNLYVSDRNDHRVRKLTPIGCTIPSTPSVTGIDTICAGGSTVLTSSSAVGNLWSTGETTQSITVSTAGYYYVYVIDNGCTSDVSNLITTIVNSVPATPTISGNNTINVGGTTVLTSSSATGNLWSNGATTQSITVSSLGTYSVKEISGSCTSASSNSIVVDRNVGTYMVSTLAGSGTIIFADGVGTAASFHHPMGVAVDKIGNVFVADYAFNRIRKITSEGVVTTVAGSGNQAYENGTGAAASFNYPAGVAVAPDGNLYVADQYNHAIRKITPDGTVSTFAGTGGIYGFSDGTGASASFHFPTGIAIDANGNLYVADLGNSSIRKITTDGVVSTLAGSGTDGFVNGTGTAASFRGPTGLTIDAFGNVYVADQGNKVVRKITAEGVVTTFAGSGAEGYADGIGTAASFFNPLGIAVDGAGNVFVGDYYSRRVRKISPDQVVTTIAGAGANGYADGLGTQAIFKTPAGIAVDSAGNIYVSDRENRRIRKLTPKGCTIPAAPNIAGVPTICSGNSTVLTSSALYGNIWSTGDTTQSITVSTAGDYSVQAYSDVCTSALSSIVTVSLAEIDFTNTATASANNICIGTSVELNTNRLLGTVINYTNNTAYNISAVGTSTIQSVINVPNSYTLLTEDTLLVKLNINHTYLGDLSITLVSPTGTRVLLFENHGSNLDNLTNTVFSNFYSGAALSSGTAPYTGVFVPDGPLFYFVNSNVAGNWTLEVTDRYNSDGGTLINWSFEVRTRGKFKGFRWSVLDGAQLDSASTMSVTPTTTTSYVVDKTFLTGCIDQDTVTVTVLPNGRWKGLTTDWNTASNWCGGVPTNTTDVSLPTSGILPIITGTTATCGNLNIPEAVILNINNGGNLNLQGNFSGLGSIVGTSGSMLTLNGSTNQTIQRVSVGNLVVNNSAGISLDGDISLKNGVTLTNGVLNTNNHTLELSADCFNPIETDNSYLAGTILAHSYPLGTGNLDMLGVTISRGPDNLDTIMIVRTDERAIVNGNEGIGHIWKIRTGDQPINGRPVTFAWYARDDNGKNLSALQIYRRPDEGGEWIRIGTVGDGTSRVLGVSTTSFSDWTISDEDAPLPVTITSFTGKATQYGNQLNWTTSSEVNNQGFNIDRSTDGKTFTKIGFVKGNGTTNTRQSYRFTDGQLSEAYYRLQQVDYDGKTEYSATIKVGEGSLVNTLDIYPNPASGKVTITTSGEGNIEIVNNLGQVLITQPAKETNEINISKLAMGVYTVKFNGVSQKLVLR